MVVGELLFVLSGGKVCSVVLLLLGVLVLRLRLMLLFTICDGAITGFDFFIKINESFNK